MLRIQTVEQDTLGLLKAIMTMEAFNEFRLVGGTALALQFGHRKSIDLDFFGDVDLDLINFEKEFSHFLEISFITNTKRIKSLLVNGIKVDFVSYQYPWLKACNKIDDLRLAFPEDIAAMKIAAITNRGAKKDFYDLYFLLKEFTLAEILGYYLQKYHDATALMMLKSITYFQDAENEDEPVMLLPATWEDVKKKILKEHKAYMDTL